MGEKSEIREVDSQGRIVLPLDWRESDLQPSNEVIIIKNKGYLKVVPMRKGNMSAFFDRVEFEDDVMDKLDEDWATIEKKLFTANTCLPSFPEDFKFEE